MFTYECNQFFNNHKWNLSVSNEPDTTLDILTFYCDVGCVSVTERDAFDTLFDHAPDKLNVVKKVSQRFMHDTHVW